MTIDTPTSNHGNTIALTWSHTVGVKSSRLLIVSTGVRGAAGSVVDVVSVTYGTQSLTLVKKIAPGNDIQTEMWQLPDPPSGTATVTVTLDETWLIAASAVSVSEAEGIRASVGTSNTTGTTSSVTVTSSPGDLVIDALSIPNNQTITKGGSQTELANVGINGTDGDYGASYRTATGDSTAMTWSWGSNVEWAGIAASIMPSHDYGFNVNRLRPKIFTPGIAR